MDSHIRHGNAGDDLLRVLQPCRHVLGRISEHAPRGLPVFGVAKPSSPLAGRRSSRRAAALRGGHAPAHPPTPDMIATDCTPSFPVIVTGCLLNPEPARNFHGSLRSLPSSARRAGGCAEMSNASPSKTAVTERASGWSDFGTRSTKSPRCARLCRRPRRGGGCDGSPPHPTLWILYASYFASLPIPVVLGCMITSATCLSFGSSRTTSLFWSLANSKSFAAGSDLSRCSEAFPASVIAGPSRRPWLESRLPPVDSFQAGRSGKSTASV